MLRNHSNKWKQKHTSFWWKPLRANHKWPHSSTLIVFLRENKLFQRGWGVFVTLVEIPRGWGVISSLQKWKTQGGEGVLSEIPSVVGSGYFLELHNARKTKLIWSRAVPNCAQSCFHLYANYLSFPSNWIILAFLRLFNLLCFILHHFCESVILSCEFTLSKGKNFEETLRLQPRRYMSILLHLHLYEINYPSLADFAGEKNIAFDFSDACLFGHPDYFDYQDFLGFASD